jgi:hypothetical protein
LRGLHGFLFGRVRQGRSLHFQRKDFYKQACSILSFSTAVLTGRSAKNRSILHLGDLRGMPASFHYAEIKAAKSNVVFLYGFFEKMQVFSGFNLATEDIRRR